MLRNIFLFSISLLLVCCNSNNKKEPVTDTDVARAFIRNLLDNKFSEARQYLLKDEVNEQYFDRMQQMYKTQDENKLGQYKNASIDVNEISYVTDSICIFNYSNSLYKDVKTKLKLVRIDNKWLVDLKYTFSGNM
jgi:hypothetical protein